MTDDLLVWLDLETTGLDEQNDPILEIAMVVTDARIERELANWQTTVWDPIWDNSMDMLDISPAVMAMHSKSGLWDDCARDGVSIREAQATAVLTLSQLGSKGSFVMAGSGVSHFDQRFLRYQTPQLAEWFKYYTIDVGVTRRLFQSMGLGHLLAPEDKDPSHRAMPDARFAMAQARYLKRTLQAEGSFLEQVLINAPESYDGDEAAEAIAIRYIRDLEAMRDGVVGGLPEAVRRMVIEG